MRVCAAAKINLFLRVGPVREDGFHPLVSWMVTVGLFDTLLIDRSRSAAVSFTCDDPSIPSDDGNFVVKAARALARQFRVPLGCTIHLSKRIPCSAGLGGGSSDAARTLKALNRLWSLDRSIDELAAIGASVGSDVPFFFQGPSAICAGRGEIVKPAPVPSVKWALLILPGVAISTADVYRQFDRRAKGRVALEEPEHGKSWAQLPAMELLPRLENDLETATFAICEPIARLRSEIEGRLGRIVRMSGSGSTLFTLFDDQAQADAAQVAASKDGTRSVVVEICPQIDDDLNRISTRPVVE